MFSKMADEPSILIPVALLRRICLAMLEMWDQGAVASDRKLEEDLGITIAEWERKQKPNGT